MSADPTVSNTSRHPAPAAPQTPPPRPTPPKTPLTKRYPSPCPACGTRQKSRDLHGYRRVVRLGGAIGPQPLRSEARRIATNPSRALFVGIRAILSATCEAGLSHRVRFSSRDSRYFSKFLFRIEQTLFV